RTGVGGGGQTETAEIVVHQIVAVPAAVVLGELEDEDGATGKTDIGRTLEHRLAFLIAPARPSIYPPGRLVVPIDGETGGTGHALLVSLVIEVRFERSLNLLEVGAGLAELYRHFVSRMRRFPGFHFELGEGAGSFEGAAGPVAR